MLWLTKRDFSVQHSDSNCVSGLWWGLFYMIYNMTSWLTCDVRKWHNDWYFKGSKWCLILISHQTWILNWTSGSLIKMASIGPARSISSGCIQGSIRGSAMALPHHTPHPKLSKRDRYSSYYPIVAQFPVEKLGPLPPLSPYMNAGGKYEKKFIYCWRLFTLWIEVSICTWIMFWWDMTTMLKMVHGRPREVT